MYLKQLFVYPLYFLALLSSTSTEGKIFKIEDIEISEKFDVNFNKEKAINNAFVIAFKELTSSIITTKDKKKFNIQNLVKLNI